MSRPFVVIAEYEATADTILSFLEACEDDATRSKSEEPGCLEFAVQRAEKDAYQVVLYEVYKDRAAFEAHEATPHFAKFAEALKELKIRKHHIRFFHRH